MKKRICGAETRTCGCGHHLRLHEKAAVMHGRRGRCSASRCKCTTFKGKPHQSTAVKENGRCRLHGGLTPSGPASPHWKTGERSKYGVLPKGLGEHFVRALAQDDGALMSLTHDIALLEARVSELLASLGHSGSTKLWKLARDRAEAFKTAIGQKKSVSGARETFAALKAVLEHGEKVAITWDEIVSTLEHKRRMTETESRKRKDMAETMSMRQGMALAQLLADAVRRHVRDPAEQGRVFMELRTILRPALTEPTTIDSPPAPPPAPEAPDAVS